MTTQRKFKCYACNHEWDVPYGSGQSGRQMDCPKCGSSNIHRIDAGGFRRRKGAGQGDGRRQ